MPRRRHPLAAGPRLWGPRRVRLNVTLRELERATGINRGDLSRMENRGMDPTSEEFDRIMAALEAVDPTVQAGTPEPAPS